MGGVQLPMHETTPCWLRWPWMPSGIIAPMCRCLNVHTRCTLQSVHSLVFPPCLSIIQGQYSRHSLTLTHYHAYKFVTATWHGPPTSTRLVFVMKVCTSTGRREATGVWIVDDLNLQGSISIRRNKELKSSIINS